MFGRQTWAWSSTRMTQECGGSKCHAYVTCRLCEQHKQLQVALRWTPMGPTDTWTKLGTQLKFAIKVNARPFPFRLFLRSAVVWVCFFFAETFRSFCQVIVLKIAVTASASLPFKILWPNWPIFFSHLKSIRSLTEKINPCLGVSGLKEQLALQ